MDDRTAQAVRARPGIGRGMQRERMQVEKEHMRVIKDGSIVENDRLEQILTVAQSLDRQMLQVMRQAIGEVLAREDVSRPEAA